MIKTTLIAIIFSFIIVLVGANAYAQTEKSRDRQENTSIENFTDKMKFLCLQSDAKNGIDQIEDKEQQKQCEEFLDRVSISEMKELIEKYLEDN